MTTKTTEERRRAQRKRAVDSLFDELDTNGDGVLDRDEMRRIAHIVSFDEADIDKSGVITREEFYQLAEKRRLKEEEERRKKLLERRAKEGQPKTPDAVQREQELQRQRERERQQHQTGRNPLDIVLQR